MIDVTLGGGALVSLLGWLVASIVVFGALRIVVYLTNNRLLRYRSVLPGPWSELLIELHKTTPCSFLVVLSLFLAHQIVPVGDRIDRGVSVVLLVVCVMQGGRWAGLVYDSVLRLMIREDRPAAVRLLGIIGKSVVWALLVLVALATLGVNVSALLTGLGIGGIAMALAVQSVLGDLLASVAIVLDKPFEIGDFIVVGDVSGTVEEIGLKNSRIRSVSGELWVVPNADLVKSRIRNYRKLEERRVVMTVAVPNQRPVELLQRIPALLSEIVSAVGGGWRCGTVHAAEIGGAQVSFEVVLYLRATDHESFMASKHALLSAIAERFRDERIELAASTQTSFAEKRIVPAS